MKDFFTPEDFCEDPMLNMYSEYAAKKANEKLNKMIESWPVVYAEKKEGFYPWHNVDFQGSTHKASLAFIEEIHKEPCKHEPILMEISRDAIYPDGEKMEREFYIFKCKHCGVELQATWTPK